MDTVLITKKMFLHKPYFIFNHDSNSMRWVLIPPILEMRKVGFKYRCDRAWAMTEDSVNDLSQMKRIKLHCGPIQAQQKDNGSHEHIKCTLPSLPQTPLRFHGNPGRER